jgi:putative ABC transport system permease protein
MKHAIRRLFREPGFTAITVLTLAIGIGANTAIFSVVESVLIKPLPYAHPDALIAVVQTAPGLGVKELPVSPSCYFIYREQNRVFQDLALWTSDTVNVTGLTEPEQVPAIDATDGLLSILGVRPALGRFFTAVEDSPTGPKTVLLSFGYWQSKFGGDPGVVGRNLTVDGEPRNIIGVLPRDFRLFDRKITLLLPFRFDRGKTTLGNFSYNSIARLKPGITMTQASAEIERLLPVVEASFPPPAGASMALFRTARIAPDLRPLKQDAVGTIGGLLWILAGAIGIVLLIACANVANLLLVRAEGRRQELAIRAALGAGWVRIAGGLLGESLMFGVAGGALGIGLAFAALRALVAIGPGRLPRLAEIGIDPTVLLFTAAISIFSGLLLGLIPALKFAGTQIAGAIRQEGRALTQSRERHRARNVLVVVQVALALVLLAGSGLMIRTFQAMRKVSPGFAQLAEAQTLTVSIAPGEVSDAEAVVRTEEMIRQRIAAIPGVSAAAFASGVPMDGHNNFDTVMVEGLAATDGKTLPIRRYKFAAPGFLQALGNPVIAGRDFTWAEINEKVPVAIVTENFAREFWRTPQLAIGHRIKDSLSGPWREIVGVVSNERDDGVEQPAPKTVYWPIMTRDFWGQKINVRRGVTYLVRSPRAGSVAFADELRRAVWSVNANLPLADVKTLDEIYSQSMARTSFLLVILGVAGGMSLLLGIIGIYGVISYSVSQRTREIGIRMALGAQRRAVIQMFVRDGLRLAGIGVVCGLAAAFALTRAMSALLFGVSAADPVTFAAVAATLALAAALAAYLPSRRAAGVAPVEALRGE